MRSLRLIEFLTMATVDIAVRLAKVTRRSSEEQRKEREARATEAARRRNYPEEYVPCDPHAILKNLGKAAPDVKARED